MIDYTDPATATQRLSHGERDDAVAALSHYASEGRLTEAEAETRAASARVAVTRGDLAPLFADLPAGAPSAAEPAAATTTTPAFSPPQSGGGPRARSWRYAVVALMPFIALALFFISGNVWGFSYAWLWFLLVPIAGIVVYGAGGYSDRDR